MDKYTIQQDLHNIVMEEIPDDMNILPDIHQQVKNTSTPWTRPMLTISRVASIIAIFILVSAGGYALFQRNLVSKDIPQQRITDINETQTLEKVAVTLNWAYGDAHRIALAYSMEYPRLDNFFNYPIVTLKTDDGLELIPDFGGGGGGGGGEPDSAIYSETIMNFDSSTIDGSPDTINLVLTLDFSADAIMSNPSMMPMSGGGGGGGGGGGSSSNGEDGNTPPATPDVSKIIDRVYIFNFSLPFYEALKVEPEVNTVESNGVSITIDNIRYTPSLTKFDMCYNMPDDEQWGATIQIVTDSVDSPFYSHQQQPIKISDDGRPCVEVSATAAIPDDADKFMIDVLFLSQPLRPLSDELARAEEEYFAELGYSIKIDANPYGYSMDMLNYPDDIDASDADEFVRASLFFKRYEGDWTFTIPLK